MTRLAHVGAKIIKTAFHENEAKECAHRSNTQLERVNWWRSAMCQWAMQECVCETDVVDACSVAKIEKC